MVSVLDIPGARLAVTTATRRVGQSADYVVPSCQAGCITGPSGVGKATALRQALDLRATPTTWVNLPPVYTPKELIQWIYLDVVGDPEDFPQRDLQDDLIVELAGSGRVVAIGNAERLTREAAGQLEWLHSRSPGWAMYFLGLPAARARLATEPHLTAALVDAIEVRALSTTELHAALTQIHDLFTTADRALIDRINQTLEGNLALWVKFLHRALHIRDQAKAAGRPMPPLNVDLARATLPDIVGTRRPKERT